MSLTVVLTVLLTVAAGEIHPGDHTRSIPVDRRTRTYLVHVPPSYDGSEPFPVVVAFHGGLSRAETMIRDTGLNEKADKAGFIVVYPNGTSRYGRLLTWNAGNCCGYAMRHNVDDVGFVRALLDDLARVAAIDPNRVYATGYSNGAMMAYRLASELSSRIAAIAPVAGPMGTLACNPDRSLSVIHFHGTDDPFAPFHGGRVQFALTTVDFYSVEHSIRAWVKANGCPAAPVITREPDTADEGTTVQRRTYGPGKDGAEVVLLVIEGGGHTWPGRAPRTRSHGKSTRDISANDLIWEFFEKHPMNDLLVLNRPRPIGERPNER
jgi:polyhydroxybutyrate depolymerase